MPVKSPLKERPLFQKKIQGLFEFWRQSVTKIVILALHVPLFDVGFKLAWLFLTTTAWHSFSRLGTTSNQRVEGTGGIFRTFS